MLSKHARISSMLLRKQARSVLCQSMATMEDPWYLHQETAIKSDWSDTLSYASPESDFCASDRHAHPSVVSPQVPIWSEALSFASPESDFVGQKTQDEDSSEVLWSGALSFASPDTDCTAEKVTTRGSDTRTAWSERLSFASPEAESIFQDKEDTSSNPGPFERFTDSLSLVASPETAIGVVHYGEMLDLATKSRLIELKQRQESLPETMSEALADSRPIVVTSAAFPFDVVDVNQAWVGLCEYTREEAVNRNLDDLLQGPETSAEVARDMISRLKRDQYSEAYLTNYTKSGRKFQNHVKVGLISGDDGTGKFYVGILEEIQSQESGNVSMKE